MENNISNMFFSKDVFLNTLMNNSVDTIYFKDLNSRFIMNNKEHIKQFGKEKLEDVIGKTDFDFFPEEFAKKALEDEKKIIETKQPILGIIEKWQRDDGSVVWFSASKYPLYDLEGELIGTWGITRIITKLKENEESLNNLKEELENINKQLHNISMHDELTGLYNRRFFYDKVSQMIVDYVNKSYRMQYLSIIILDIDEFKQVNDRYGHNIGDKVIRDIANILRMVAGDDNLSFRYGGDEFVVLCPNANKNDVIRIAEEIRENVMLAAISLDKVIVHNTVSIGVASIDELVTCNLNDFVDLADRRLYYSKHNGRNRVSYE